MIFQLYASVVKLAFHDADTDILARIVAKMSVSVTVSVSASWNFSFTASSALPENFNVLMWNCRIIRPSRT